MLNPHSLFGGPGSGARQPAAAGTGRVPSAFSAGAVWVVGAARPHQRGCEGTVPSQQLCLGYVTNETLPPGILAAFQQAPARVLNPQGLHYVQPRLRISARCFEPWSAFQKHGLRTSCDIRRPSCLSPLGADRCRPSGGRRQGQPRRGCAPGPARPPPVGCPWLLGRGRGCLQEQSSPHVAKAEAATCMAGVGILSGFRELSALGQVILCLPACS